MPKYAALTIPSPLESIQRVHSLKTAARQGRAQEMEMAAYEREQQEDAALREALTGATPETFQTEVFPRLQQINPMKALQIAREYQQTFGKAKEEPYTLSPGQRRFVGGQEVAAVPERPPAPEPGFTLSPGQARYGSTGDQIATVPSAPDEPASIDAAILAADRQGNRTEVQRLLRLKAQSSAAGREPDGADDRAATLAQKAGAERWKQGALTDLEQRFQQGQSGAIDSRTGQPFPRIDVRELERLKADIQKSYLAQIGLQPQTIGATSVSGGVIGPRGAASRASVLPPSMRGAPAAPSAPMPPQAPVAPPPMRAGGPGPRAGGGAPPVPPPVATGTARVEARRILDQLKTEPDPAKQEALRARLQQLRAVLAGEQ